MDTGRVHPETLAGDPFAHAGGVGTVGIESGSRPGLVHRVDPEAGRCSCEATVEVCRHVRQARIRAAKARMAALRDRYDNEDMDPGERLELAGEIAGLRRRLGLA